MRVDPCFARSGYKQTEVGLIPRDWDVIPLALLCRSICDGTHFTPHYVSKGIPFYSVENVTANDFVNTKFISESEHLTLIKRCRPERGDILMTRITAGILGDTKLLDWDVNASIYVSLALLKPNDRICSTYLYGYSQSSSFRRDVEKRGLINATPKKINMEAIGAIPIPVPPTRAEQEAIVKGLSDADTLIDWLEQLLAKKREVKLGAMQQLFTGKRRLPGFSGKWTTTRLGSLGATYGGLTGKTKADFGNGNARYITFLNVMNNVVVDLSQVESVKVRPGEHQNAARKGDIFFNGSSETPGEVGMCAVLLEDVTGLYLNSFCFGFRLFDDQTDRQYLTHFFRSCEGRKLLYSLAQGATRHNLSKTALMKIEFDLPKSKEQTAIASLISDTDAEIAALEAKLAKARQIKQGMMQDLLTGKIRLV